MILVTGSGGFIGSHVVQNLLNKGQKVRAFVHYNAKDIRGNLRFLARNEFKKLDIFAGDLLHLDEVIKAMEGVDKVIHLAARISVSHSYRASTHTVLSNVTMFLNILEAAKLKNIDNIVYVSSSEVYGTPSRLPITLTTFKKAQSPYAASKVATDEIARSYALSFNMNIKIARPFNTYGERQSVRAVIPWILYQLISDEFDHISIGNIHTKRDFVYVGDTARFLTKMLDIEGFSEVNFPTGMPYTIEEVIKMSMKVTGIEKEIVLSDNRKRPNDSEVQVLTGDAKETFDIIGIKPEISLEDGLFRVSRWIKEHLNYIQKEHSVL